MYSSCFLGQHWEATTTEEKQKRIQLEAARRPNVQVDGVFAKTMISEYHHPVSTDSVVCKQRVCLNALNFTILASLH